jgi:hypothetical protein
MEDSLPILNAEYVKVKHLKSDTMGQVFENPYLLSGYRANFGMIDCIWSMFQWHNDTINVWSHLLGTFLFISFVVLMIIQVSKAYESLATFPLSFVMCIDTSPPTPSQKMQDHRRVRASQTKWR